jgi:ATP-binding protein involved in chromosome partitioning
MPNYKHILFNFGIIIFGFVPNITQVLSSGGGRGIAEDMQVPFLGAIPMDPMVAVACDNGRPFVQHYSASPTAKIMQQIIAPIAALDQGQSPDHQPQPLENKQNTHMRIVIPLADGKLTSHFGHCASFALVDVDPAEKIIVKREDIEAPPHEPGLLPPWLAERGANLIIAGDMGHKARELFTEQGIQVMVGAIAETPEKLAADYLAGTLQLGENVCDH